MAVGCQLSSFCELPSAFRFWNVTPYVYGLLWCLILIFVCIFRIHIMLFSISRMASYGLGDDMLRICLCCSLVLCTRVGVRSGFSSLTSKSHLICFLLLLVFRYVSLILVKISSVVVLSFVSVLGSSYYVWNKCTVCGFSHFYISLFRLSLHIPSDSKKVGLVSYWPAAKYQNSCRAPILKLGLPNFRWSLYFS